MNINLEELRGQIDAIDKQMVELFKNRMEIAGKVAEYKKEKNLPVLDAGRERALLGKIADMAGEDFADYAQSMYRTILSASRSYQNEKIGKGSKVYEGIRDALSSTRNLFPQRPTVACQGIEGAYSQIACDRLFKAPTIMFFQSFDHVFKAVESGMCQYGILPIENSTAGSVNSVYDLMMRHNFSIVRSARLKVDHNLLVKPGVKLSDIKGERTADALADIIEYIGEIADDENARAVFADIGGKSVRELLGIVLKNLPALLRTHKNAVYGIFKAVSGDEGYVERSSLPDMINDVRELLTDDCFTGLFQSAQNDAAAISLVSAPESTGDAQPGASSATA